MTGHPIVAHYVFSDARSPTCILLVAARLLPAYLQQPTVSPHRRPPEHFLTSSVQHTTQNPNPNIVVTASLIHHPVRQRYPTVYTTLTSATTSHRRHAALPLLPGRPTARTG
jgi:hypothetical protein